MTGAPFSPFDSLIPSSPQEENTMKTGSEREGACKRDLSPGFVVALTRQGGVERFLADSARYLGLAASPQRARSAAVPR